MIRYWVALLLSFAANASHGMIQCIYYDEMVAEAAVVVQLETPKISEPDAGGNCTISGPVAQVFAGALTQGDWIEASVPCFYDEPIAGPTIWSDEGALKAAKVIELHLDGSTVAGYGAGIVLLDALTREPAWKPLCEGE